MKQLALFDELGAPLKHAPSKIEPAVSPKRTKKSKRLPEWQRAEAYEKTLASIDACKSVSALASAWATVNGAELGEDWYGMLIGRFWMKCDRLGVSRATEKKQVDAGSFPARPENVPGQS